LEFAGEIHGKPHTSPEARRRWREMRGSSGVLHSGHWLIDRRTGHLDNIDRPREVGEVASTTVHFADLSDAEIDAYVATGEPLHVAGAFTVDGLGGPYISSIEGDYHAVVGVSLPLVRTLLMQFGIAWHELRPHLLPSG
ncbi:MAG: Maf family protein, partial [Ornithinimicrobium sp.]